MKKLLRPAIQVWIRAQPQTSRSQAKQWSDLSEAASTLRTSEDPQERSEAAQQMGHAGGKSHGGSQGGHQGGHQKGQQRGGQGDLSEAGKTMKSSDDSQKRSEAAQQMGQAGGKSHGGGQKGHHQKGQQSGGQGNLSQAAKTMKTSDDPQERSEAAQQMGHAGGQARKGQ